MSFFASLIQKLKGPSFFSRLSFVCILLTLFCLPLLFFPSFRGTFDLPKEVFLYSAVSLIFIFSLFEILQTRTIRHTRTILDKPFLFLLGSGLLSTLLSLQSNLSFWGRPDTFVIHFFALFLFLTWSWFLIQKIQSEKFFSQAIHVFLLSGIGACLFFLVSEFSFFHRLFDIQFFNPVAKPSSVFGMYVVTLFILSVGILLLKNRKHHILSSILSGVCALSSGVVFIRLDFQVLWVLLCVGMGLLFLLGMAFWGKIRKSMIALVFGLFLFSLFHLLVPSTFHVGRPLPTEINLNPNISKTIVESSLTQNTKNFLFGSGPGTFVYDFSQFRPAIMNEDAYFWGVRFDSPWSSLFSWVSEFGFVGTIAFFLILLLVLGSVLSAFLHIRSTLWEKTTLSLSKSDFRFEYFVFMIAWIVLTIGFFVGVLNFALWFIWWTLLAFVVIGLSYIQPSLVQKQEKTFEINSQYIFVFSFFFLVLSAVTVVGGVLWWKILAAEKLVYTAQGTSEKSQQILIRALEYQPHSSEYALLLARNYFDMSLSQAAISPTEAARLLSQAIDFARLAKETDPHNVRVFEILSASYLQTLPYVNERAVAQSLAHATDAVTTALRLEPTNPLFYSQMGFLQEFSGQLDLAKKSYEQAIFLKSNYLQGYFDLSRFYEKQNDIASALDVYEQYLTKDNQNPDILYELGRLYYNRKQVGDEERAEKLWIQAVNFQPRSSNALYSLGLLYERRGQKALAKEYYLQVYQFNPENKDIERKIQGL